MKSKITFIPALSLIFLSSCINPGKIIKNTVKSSDEPTKLLVYHGESVNQIISNDLFDIEYSQGEDNIKVIVTEQYADLVKLSVSDGVLKVGFPDGFKCQSITAKVIVSSPTITSIESTGIGDISLSNIVKGENITLTTSGTGDITINTLQAKEVALLTYGTGDIDFNSVSATSLNLETSGTGDIEGKQVDCSRLRLNSSGTGDIEVQGTAGSTIANSSGTGDINIRGLKTADYTANSSGTGGIRVSKKNK